LAGIERAVNFQQESCHDSNFFHKEIKFHKTNIFVVNKISK